MTDDLSKMPWEPSEPEPSTATGDTQRDPRAEIKTTQESLTAYAARKAAKDQPRDPKTDPRPGDAVMFGPQWQSERIEVLSRDGQRMCYSMETGYPGYCSVSQWQKWMEGAEVIHVAE